MKILKYIFNIAFALMTIMMMGIAEGTSDYRFIPVLMVYICVIGICVRLNFPEMFNQNTNNPK